MKPTWHVRNPIATQKLSFLKITSDPQIKKSQNSANILTNHINKP